MYLLKYWFLNTFNQKKLQTAALTNFVFLSLSNKINKTRTEIKIKLNTNINKHNKYTFKKHIKKTNKYNKTENRQIIASLKY